MDTMPTIWIFKLEFEELPADPRRNSLVIHIVQEHPLEEGSMELSRFVYSS